MNKEAFHCVACGNVDGICKAEEEAMMKWRVRVSGLMKVICGMPNLIDALRAGFFT